MSYEQTHIPPPSPGPMAKGRICAAPGCKTLLCSYNVAPTCTKHGGWPAEMDVTMVHCADDLQELMEGP